MGQKIYTNNGKIPRLSYFIECLLSSCPSWDIEEGMELCTIGAEISELLSCYPEFTEKRRQKFRIRSSLLYEIAQLPVLSAAVLSKDDFTGLLIDLFSRKGFFGKLSDNYEIDEKISSMNFSETKILDCALSSDALLLAKYEQGISNLPQHLISNKLVDLAKHVSMGMNATDIKAFNSVISNRFNFATRNNVDDSLFQILKEI